MNRILKIILGILAAIAVLTGIFTVASIPMKRALKGRVRLEMARAIPCPFTTGDIRVGLLRGVEVSDLRLFETKTDGRNEQFFQARKIRLSLGLGAILHPTAPFTGLTIQRATLMAVRSPDGLINLVELARRFRSPEDEKTALPRIRIENLRVDWLDYASATTPVYEKFQIKTASIHETGDGACRLNDVLLTVRGTTLAARGSWNATPGRPVDLRLKAEPLRLEDLSHLVRLAVRPRRLPPVNLNGSGSFTARVSGVRGGERLEGSLTVLGGYAGGRRIRRALVRFRPGAGDSITFREVSLRTDDNGLLLLRGSLARSAPWKFDLNASARRFPVEALLGIGMKHAPLTGSTNARLTLSGDASDTLSISGDGAIEIQGGAISDRSRPQAKPSPYQDITATFTVGHGTVMLSEARLSSEDLHLDVKGSVGLNDRRLDLSGKCYVSKKKVKVGFWKRVVSTVLPDSRFGYRFPVHIGGTLDAPDIGIRTAQTLSSGVQDNVRDAGNRIEKFFKKVF